MLKRAWFIARKDVLYTLRDRETIAWIFFMPAVFFWFIGTVTGGMGSGGGGSAPIALVSDSSGEEGDEADVLVEALADRLTERELKVSHHTTAELDAGTVGLPRVIVPAGWTEAVLAGEAQDLVLEREDRGNSSVYTDIKVNRAVYTLVADLAALAAEETAVETEGIAELHARERAFSLEVRPVGKRREIPSGYEQTIPGILVMFTLLALLTGGATFMVVERKQGVLKRLAAAPLTRGEIVLGKWFGKMFLGLIQIAVAMTIGTLGFGMDWGPDFGMIAVVLVAWAALCASLGLVAGSLANHEGTAVGIGVLISNSFAALGGCWWPIEITPDWMQGIANLLPTGWTMNALHQLISFQSGPSGAFPWLFLLIGGAFGLGLLAVRVFRYE